LIRGNNFPLDKITPTWYNEVTLEKERAMDKCIKCGSSWEDDDWYFDSWECEGDTAWQRITCNKCGFAWNCVYTFSHHEDADTLEVLPDNERVNNE